MNNIITRGNLYTFLCFSSLVLGIIIFHYNFFSDIDKSLKDVENSLKEPTVQTAGKVSKVVEFTKGRCKVTINGVEISQDTTWVDIDKTMNAQFCRLSVGDSVIIKKVSEK